MADFMRPIIDLIVKEAIEEQENRIVHTVRQVTEINVDKERLVQALTDARKFWDEGYEAGRASLRPKGEWIYNTDDFTPKKRCTNCGYNKPLVAGEAIKQEPDNFCPNCGADMRGETP